VGDLEAFLVDANERLEVIGQHALELRGLRARGV
jgi:hypothetical protein